MAFITNQWLKHLPGRVRPHEPIKTEIVREDMTDTWCRENKIKASFRMIRDDGMYQAVLLTSKDLEYLAPQLILAADAGTQARIAHMVLESLAPKSLFGILADLFKKQAKAANS